MAAVQTHTEIKNWEYTDVLTTSDETSSLIVWNDEVNTFEWVIETLMEVCGHTEEQAEQCSMIIHTKGKYAVKEGSYEILKPQCDAITERGINATIEVFEK
ncbi:ATP-dependent Clp protease adaptor ClpS [Ferruginibacter sp.]